MGVAGGPPHIPARSVAGLGHDRQKPFFLHRNRGASKILRLYLQLSQYPGGVAFAVDDCLTAGVGYTGRQGSPSGVVADHDNNLPGHSTGMAAYLFQQRG